MKKALLPALGLCLFLFAALPAAADIVVGLPADPGTGNCYPLSCSYSSEYQQVYTHSLFPGTMTITGLQFFNTQYNAGVGTLGTGTWTFSLSTTSADWNTLSTNFAGNLGADNTTVFSGDLFQSWAFGDTLTINFTTPFTYNPADGNLLLDVVSSSSSPNGSIYFDTNGYNNGGYDGNTIFGRNYCPGGGGCGSDGTVNAGYGLVTGFITGNPTTPEPASLLLMGSGLLMLGGYVRRKLAR